ncbi:MAG TPA: hypothetical protein VF950_06710 [Planctomycetota bacterium]
MMLLLALAQASSYEAPPVRYSATAAADPVAKLDVPLARDDDFGYLKSFLAALDIPASSQTLVFSKTSFQLRRISPRSPRALYFNDDVYVGWVRGGDVMEISAVDPQLGAVFYTLSQKDVDRPRPVRQTDACLQCHDSRGMSLGVPGHVVRSVYPAGDGTPQLSLGTFRTNYKSPFAERWGGWYVTGEHGAMRHLGNVTFPENPDVERLAERGANVTDLSDRVDVEAYLAPTSDIVALLVLEHQTLVHNLITRANHETRVALVQCEDINRLCGDPPGTLTDGTRSRIRSNCEPLVEALFFSEEAPLTARVRGTSGFAEAFEKRGPLRKFDLQRRLFALPCSYLIYSKAFAGLPAVAKAYVAERMRDILLGRDASPAYAHLSAVDRAEILRVLRETHPDFALTK